MVIWYTEDIGINFIVISEISEELVNFLAIWETMKTSAQCDAVDLRTVLSTGIRHKHRKLPAFTELTEYSEMQQN